MNLVSFRFSCISLQLPISVPVSAWEICPLGNTDQIKHHVESLHKIYVAGAEPQGAAKYASGLAPTAQFPNGSQFQSYIHRNPIPYAQVQNAKPFASWPSCCRLCN